MIKTHVKIIGICFILLILILPIKIANAATLNNYTEKKDDTYIVPYGKEVSLKTDKDEEVTVDDTKKARIIGDKLQIIGVGKFTLTVQKGSSKEKIKLFGWNVKLKNGKYWTYNDKERKSKSDVVYSKTYFAVSETSNSKAFKIEEHLFISGSYASKLDGKYLTNYYDKKKNSSLEPRYYSYSMEKKFPDILVTKLELKDTNLRVKLGEKVSTSVKTILPENASDKTVVWEVSDDDTLELVSSKKGTVVGIKEGKAKLIAKAVTSDNVKAECEIEVYREEGQVIPVEKIELDKTNEEILKTDTLKIKAIITPSYADNRKVTWTSSDTSIATVEKGLVKPLKEGTVTITATVGKDEDQKSATCKVKINDGKAIHQYSYSGVLKKEYKDSSINVRVEDKDGYYITKIWVKNPAKQLKKVEAGWRKEVKSVNTMLNNTKNAIVGCNASGFLTASFKAGSSADPRKLIRKTSYYYTTEGYIVLTGGEVRRNLGNSNATIGILPNGSFKYYEYNSYEEIKADGVLDTFTFGPLILKDGKDYKQKVGSLRKNFTQIRYQSIIGQVDENNFIILTAKSKKSLNQAAKIGKKLDCKFLYNFDGGGSASLWFRKGTSGKGALVNKSGNGRSVADALCFVTIDEK